MENKKQTNENFAKALFAAALGAALADAESEQKKEHKIDFRKKTAELAKPLYESYLGFMDAGFNEKQAFALLMSTQRKGE